MTGGQQLPATSPPPKSRSAWLSWPAWTGVGSLAALLALGVAVAAWWWPQSAESVDPAGAGQWVPSATPSAASTSEPATPGPDPVASAPAPSAPAGSAATATGTANLASPSGTAAEAGPATRASLYQLPANSAGQAGQQRTPWDVNLAGNRYARSTGMWTWCPGRSEVPVVTFYTNGKFQHLAGTLGIIQSAPTTMSVTAYLYGDGEQVGYFTVNYGQALPIDLDISRYQNIGFEASSLDGCPRSDKPYVYIGDAVVF